MDIHHDTAKPDVCKVCNLMSLTDIDAYGSVTSVRRLSKPIAHKVLSEAPCPAPHSPRNLQAAL